MSVPGESGTGRRHSKSSPPTNISIDVDIDEHYNSKVYTSGSRIRGQVTIESTQDAEFDSISVCLAGTATTTIDLNRQFPTTNSRPFMALFMPIPNGLLPESQVLASGARYTVPFDFTLPEQLSISACTHICPDSIREQHLQPPPTMGVGGGWEGNDGSPRGASIEYAIKTLVVLTVKESLGREKKQIKNDYVLKVLPAVSEDAPLDITRQDEGYTLAKSLTLRKSFGLGKVGDLRATASQPSAVMLSPDGREASSSSIRLDLIFSPSTATDINSLKLGGVTGKLQCDTIYSVRPMDKLPKFGSQAYIGTDKYRNHSSTSALFSTSAGEIEWTKHSAGTQETSPSEYKAVVNIPFSIPISRDRVLLPSFNSCLISRAYSIHIKLSAGPNSATLGLSVPLQVGVNSTFGHSGAEPPPTFETAVAGGDHQHQTGISASTQSRNDNEVLPGYTARS